MIKDLLFLLREVHFANSYIVFIVPFVMMGTDIITGLSQAWKNHNIRSSKMRDGLAKKIGEISLIFVCAVMCYCVSAPQEVYYIVPLYVTLCELLSIVENIDKLGFELPDFVSSKLNNVNTTITKGDMEDIQKSIIELRKLLKEFDEKEDDDNE